MEDGKYILPTFIIPGAQKSGTTFLASILSHHPDIFMAFPKEPAFFSRNPVYGFYDKGLDYYQKFYTEYRGQRHTGEASTLYMCDPDSPELIKRHIPHARLIFMLRNPVDRVYASYWQDIKQGRKLGDFKMLLFGNHERIQKIIHVSRYEIHLKRYLKYFDRNQMLLLLYDELIQDATSVINRSLSFLGLENHLDQNLFNAKMNPASLPYSKMFEQLIRNPKLRRFAQGILPAKTFNYIARTVVFVKNSLQKPQQYPDMDKESRDYLLRLFDKPISDLSVMIGKDLSSWRELAK